MSETAVVLGIAPAFKFEGLSLALSERTYEHEALFEAWLAQNELDWISRLPDFAEKALRNLGRNMASRAYAWRGELAHAAINEMPGWKYMAYLRLAEKNKSVTPELIDRIVKDEKAFARLQFLLRWLDDPNRKGTPPPEEEAPPSPAAAPGTTAANQPAA